MFYNFCRPHKTLNKERNLNITPAMATGITNKMWTIEDVINLTLSN